MLETQDVYTSVHSYTPRGGGVKGFTGITGTSNGLQMGPDLNSSSDIKIRGVSKIPVYNKKVHGVGWESLTIFNEGL